MSFRSDAALLALRPALAVAPATGDATAGDFLHHTLRPVLKMQNELLLAVVADFVRDHHVPLATASVSDQQRLLTELLTRNVKLRYTVIGIVSGLFTSDELAYYRQHRPELNRRLLELAVRRVQDQAEEVVKLLAV
ncbi:hypothetical protein J0X19_03370 [Hymenobacter sp. BT186]|uniref:Glyoxalase n=1 Tax=Hymenobacter telluris TaxID=2816474 RepID=A0A939ET47_9BACT|nr:hypothetical protein [Hymenobacter telluris]MBO0356973.1 hypothetical protein [Hymenobacter telluris]MBW3373000.1 hypothetical protein [Hymenobacter norwichensis]